MILKYRFLPFLFLFLIFICVFPNEVNATTTPIDTGTYNVPTPTKLVVTYAFTKNSSITATSLGGGMYQWGGDPTRLWFETNATDQFEIDIKIFYTSVVNQTIIYGVWGVERLYANHKLNVNTDMIYLHFTLITFAPEKYPTVEELEAARRAGFKQDMKGLVDEITDIGNFVKSNVYTLIAVSGLAIAFGVIAVFGVIVLQSRLSTIEAERRPAVMPAQMSAIVAERNMLKAQVEQLQRLLRSRGQQPAR